MLPLVRSLQLADMLPCIAFHMTRDNVTRFAKAMENQLRKEEEIAQEKEVILQSRIYRGFINSHCTRVLRICVSEFVTGHRPVSV
jgi:hypothetical protein